MLGCNFYRCSVSCGFFFPFQVFLFHYCLSFLGTVLHLRQVVFTPVQMLSVHSKESVVSCMQYIAEIMSLRNFWEFFIASGGPSITLEPCVAFRQFSCGSGVGLVDALVRDEALPGTWLDAWFSPSYNRVDPGICCPSLLYESLAP